MAKNLRESENESRAAGVQMTNTLSDRGFNSVGEWQAHLATFSDEPVYWTDDRLERITVLRLLSDRGFPQWDVSYCHGQLKDGTNVRVQLPFGDLPKKGMSRAIIEWAKRDGVYAKGLGILGAVSTLNG